MPAGRVSVRLTSFADPQADVGDDDGELGDLAGADRIVRRGLDHLDVRAEDRGDIRGGVVIGGRRVVRLVGRIDRDRVRDETAVGGVGRAHDVDVAEAPAARSAGPKLSTPAVIDQPLAGPSMVQSIPAGRVSEPVAP